jgi:hypothetical protein
LKIGETKLQALRAHLAEGARQADAGQFVDGFSIEGVIGELDAELDAQDPENINDPSRNGCDRSRPQ